MRGRDTPRARHSRPDNFRKRAEVDRSAAWLRVFASHFKASDFTEPDQVIQIGRAPNRIDLLTGITGVTSDEAFARQVEAPLDGIPVCILSREMLIKNKRAVGRPQDLADLDALER